ncbi:hypothetical protein ACWB45_10580 [Streptococcus parasuis]
MKIKTIEISGFRQILNATFNLEDNCLCKKTRVWISLDLCKESGSIISVVGKSTVEIMEPF